MQKTANEKICDAEDSQWKETTHLVIWYPKYPLSLTTVCQVKHIALVCKSLFKRKKKEKKGKKL